MPFDTVEFHIYAAICAALALKMVLQAFAVAGARLVHRSWSSPEDVKLLGGSTNADSLVDRLRRGHLNALENEPLFMILGLLFVLVAEAPVVGIQAYGYTFFLARLVHTLTYAAALQPFRTLGYAIGALCLMGMSVQILMAAFA